MKITVTGHSLINPRQYMLFSHMGKADLAEVQCLAPSQWGSETGETEYTKNYRFECLEPVGQGMLTFRLRGLEGYIKDFEPDVLYVMEEPYTPFALQCSKIAKKLNIPMAVFTWENLVNIRFNDTEKDVIDASSILVAGNEGAKQRLIHMGAAEDKIAICPQTGIATDIFKPMPDVEKAYDVTYFGRMVKEKGIEYIENVVQELNLEMLWIGGRSNILPSYGIYLGWIDYLKLPEYYNKTKLFVTYPYAFNGYSEQFNYSIGESLACGTLVVSSDNGSILDVYGDAPIVFAKAAEAESLKKSIKYALDKPYKRAEQGIKWVDNNLSVQVISQKLVEILKNEKQI